MMSFKKNNKAVSEVLGTILLLVISVSLFSVVYVSLFSIDVEPNSPSINLVGTIDNNKLFLEHRGGEDISDNGMLIMSYNGGSRQKDLITNHVAKTGSKKGQLILDNWAEYLPKFWQVVPPSEAENPEAKAQKELTTV